MKPIASIFALLAVALAPACGPSSGGGAGARATGGSAAPPVATGATGGGSPTNEAQWRTALAALAQAPSPDPVRFEPLSLAVYDDLVARNWPHVVPRVLPVLETELRAALSRALQGLSIVSIRSMAFDLQAPPALEASPPAPRQTVELHLPRFPGAWSAALSAEVGGTVTVLGVGIGIRASVNVTVSDIRVRQPVVMDLSNATNPSIVSAGLPLVDLRIALSSPDPILSTLLPALTRALDPLVRGALVVGAVVAQREIGLALQSLPQGPYWGTGGPAVQPLAGAPPIEPLALAVDEEIQRSHMPFGQVYPAVFDAPDRGGSVVGWRHHGDSALWSGAYLGLQAYRWDLTRDPRALAGATAVVRALEVMSRLPPPGDGLLARCAVPTSSPHAAALGGPSSFTGVVDGQAYIGYGDTSRDSYTGTFFGLGQAWHRIPALRGEVLPIVERLLDHLERRDWAVYQAPGQGNIPPGGPVLSVTFVQAPIGILAISTIGATANPARWDALRQRCAPLSDLLWFNAWASAREMHEGYYGFSLEHFHLMTLVELDTDPYRYRGYLRLLGVLREAIGHHQNPWFDAAYGVAVPPARAPVAPLVRMELERWTLRPRRGFTILNSRDPAIAKTTYTTARPNATGSPNSGYSTGPRTYEVAVHAVPIEKRPPTAFLFSSSPFDLDGSQDPYEQNPGIDLLLPYWIARSHGILP